MKIQLEQWAELEPKDTYIQVEKMRRIVEHIADLGKALEIRKVEVFVKKQNHHIHEGACNPFG